MAGQQVGQRHPVAAGEVAGRLAPRDLCVGDLLPRVDHPRGERLDEPSRRPRHLLDLLGPVEQLRGVHSLRDGVDDARGEVVGIGEQAFGQARPPHRHIVAGLPDYGKCALSCAAVRHMQVAGRART